MPLQQILPTWTALNGGTFTSPSGMTDVRTGLPFAAGGLNVGDYFDITQEEAKQLSFTATGTLLAGRYRFVQIDSGATAANVATGTIGLLRNTTGGSYTTATNYVTTTDQANTYLSDSLPRKVVFLCPITAGQTPATGVFAFIQELGLANVLVNTNTGGAIGGPLNVATNGVTANSAATASTQATVGIAMATPVAGSLCLTQLTAPAFQD